MNAPLVTAPSGPKFVKFGVAETPRSCLMPVPCTATTVMPMVLRAPGPGLVLLTWICVIPVMLPPTTQTIRGRAGAPRNVSTLSWLLVLPVLPAKL